MLVVNCAAWDTTLRGILEQNSYRATTDYLLKEGFRETTANVNTRRAEESDIPELMSFNREARRRLQEANPVFWNSHPEAEARFAFWMKVSLSMRDRSIFVVDAKPGAKGFVISQPASPVQVPVYCDDRVTGVVDDFHCDTFGSSLTEDSDPAPALALMEAAEADLAGRGLTAAVAICPTAWTSKARLLDRAGYRVLTTWFTKQP